MTVWFKVACLFTLILNSSCEEDVIPEHLLNCWALQETVDDRSTFLLCGDENLEPSRYRQSYHFKDNNVCTYSVLHPTDAHYLEDGIYLFSESNNELRIYNKKENLLERFKVQTLRKDELIVQEL